MIDKNGWFSWTFRAPGPAARLYPGVNTNAGMVWHSMEGWYPGSFAVLTDPSRLASWHFSIKLDGSVMQHYPITACCWASGNEYANRSFWAMELEGQAGTPINEAQMVACRHIIREYEAHAGKVATRGTGPEDVARTLWEHREVAAKWGAPGSGTACPSNRYDPLWEAMKGEKPVDAEVQALKAMLMTLTARTVRLEALVAGNGYGFNPELVGEAAMVAAFNDGGSLFKGLGVTQAALAAHEARSMH